MSGFFRCVDLATLVALLDSRTTVWVSVNSLFDVISASLRDCQCHGIMECMDVEAPTVHFSYVYSVCC